VEKAGKARLKMSYDPKERDDFDYGKRIYKQKTKGKPVYLLVIVLVVVLAGLIILILPKETIEETHVPGYDAADSPGLDKPVVSQVETGTEEYGDDTATGETFPGTGTDTDTAPGTFPDADTAYPSIDQKLYGDIENKIFGETHSHAPPGDLRERAKDYIKAGEFEKALPLIKELVAGDDSLTVLVGLCYYGMKDYSNARYYLQKALMINKNDALAMKYMALTCWELNDPDNSLRYAKAALEELKWDAQLQFLLSRLKREMKAMDGYGKAQRVNFSIVFSKFEHSNVRVTVSEFLEEAFLEEAYHDIGREMDAYPSSPVSVILYNEKNFSEVTRAPGWAGGLYDQLDGKIRIPIKGMSVNEPRLKFVLYHEYTHALIHSITTFCPRWIHEGLANYLAFDSIERGRIRTIGQIIPLKYLDAAFFHRNVKIVGLAYLESYSVVSYLIDRYRMYRIKGLLEDLGKGTDFNTAFSSAFSISYDQFQKTWGKE
jgi:tetratricopeptide (TPR) repeat protein